MSIPSHSCQQCGNILQQEHISSVCGICQLSPPPFSHCYYACCYQTPIDKWVMALKFGGKVIYSRLFAEMLSLLISHIPHNYVLMPVPLHQSRLRKRGYNQAYEIAKEISKINSRILDTSLIRQKNTAMQAQLELKHRAKNVSKAFALNQPLQSTNIILVDDVMTSGNTLKECAKTLKKAGAIDIRILVFARKSMN
jgi:ComF family protein